MSSLVLGDGRFQGLRAEAELILLAAGHMDRHTARQGGDGLIADKARLRDDDFVPRLHHGADAHINGLTAAHGDQHLAQRVVVQVHPALQIAADLCAQLLQARIGGIAGAAVF